MAEAKYPGKLGIKKNPALSGGLKDQEQQFVDYAEQNPDYLTERYLEANKNVVDVDRARKLFPEYNESNDSRTKLSESVHEPASAVAKAAYQRILDRQGSKGKPAIFVIGGCASGKTFAIDDALKGSAAVVTDTQMSNYDSSVKKIDAALDSGRNVLLYYIDRPPELAVVGMLDRAIEMGRIVPVDSLAGSHVSSQQTLRELYEKYQGEPRVRFYAVSNAGSDKDIKQIPIDKILKRDIQDPEQLSQDLRKVVENERVRREGTKSEIPGSILEAALKPQPKSKTDKGDLGKTGGQAGRDNDKKPEEQRRKAAAGEDSERTGDGSAAAQASAVQKQPELGDAEAARSGQRDPADDAVHADTETGAAQPAAESAGGATGATGLDDGISTADTETDTSAPVPRDEPDTEATGPTGTSGTESVASAQAAEQFQSYLATPQAAKDYTRLFGKVISIDQVKELSSDFAASNESRAQLGDALQKPAKGFAWKLYEDALKKPATPPQMPLVLATAGGTGSGKTESIHNGEWMKLYQQAQIVWDNTWHDYKEAKRFVDMALDAGKRVVISAVYRDPVEAFVDGVVPRAQAQGRAVPIEHHALSHAEVGQTLQRLAEDYKGNLKVQIQVIDNSKGKGNAESGGLDLYKREAAA